MVSRDDFERVIDSFLLDLRGVCAGKSLRELQAIPDFYKEYQESVALLKHEHTSGSDYLPLAFGMIDEFVRASWQEVVEGGYRHYRAVAGSRQTPP